MRCRQPITSRQPGNHDCALFNCRFPRVKGVLTAVVQTKHFF